MSHPAHTSDLVGDVDGSHATPRKALHDTIWIALWTFDTGDVCDFSGWEKVDNRILNDGQVFWDVDAGFDGTGGISGNAATLGYEDDLCCDAPDGYDNGWYQAIRIDYAGGGAATLSFDYLLDSEEYADFLQVEVDSACSSQARITFDTPLGSQSLRTVLFSDDGYTPSGSVVNLPLIDYGPGVHCVYIAFIADDSYSPCDGLQPTTLGQALVVDNIVVSDANGVRSEDFANGALDLGVFLNVHDSFVFGPTDPGYDGSWGRTFKHVTDNDICVENTSCSLLWTDDTTPTLANDPSMSFGPGGYVVKNWLDDVIMSPWISLASTPGAYGTVIQFDRFGGNSYTNSRIVQNWSVRGKKDVDDGMGGTLECVSGWGHASQWNSLTSYRWTTPTAAGNPPNSGYSMSSSFDPSSDAIQVRFRTSDWQWIRGASAPTAFIPGPGPYVDRARIGRVFLPGPVFSALPRQLAQDGFPTEPHSDVTPGLGEHHQPTNDRFGTAAFTSGFDLGSHCLSPNLITGDSISIEVEDLRAAGGVQRVELWGAIVSGPHAGLAPPPHAVDPSGFFVVSGDSVIDPWSGSVIAGRFFVDLDDEYFVGGDAVQYLWLAEDFLAGISSFPVGLTAEPTSPEAAELATGGLFEVNFLPAIDWDADYLAAVGASNKVDPNSDPSFLDDSIQRNCILYVQGINGGRRSGDINRTTFMYALDQLGYRDSYDVYDVMMHGQNAELGGRATVEQSEGYSLIVYDTGDGFAFLPDGGACEFKIDQVGWFQDWLAQAVTSEAGTATLWLLGANIVEHAWPNDLYATEMQVTWVADGQSVALHPDVVGQAAFTFHTSMGSSAVDFTSGAKASYSLVAECTIFGTDYDAAAAIGTGVEVYRYVHPQTGVTGEAAMVMNANPAGNWNTILQSHPWFDIRNTAGEPAAAPTSANDLLLSILGATVAPGCAQGDAVDVGEREMIDAPQRTALYRNTPNPFNPVTTIRFDLAQRGLAKLRIFDVSGRLVRTLVNGTLERERHNVVWDGLDDSGHPVASGMYIYRLTAGDFTATHKMVVLR